MKLFSEFRSCYRPHNTPSSAAPPSDSDSHHVAADASSPRGRPHRSHWRPSLAVIMEDSVDQHQHTNVNSKNIKSPKKVSSPKSRSSSFNASCSFHIDYRTRNCIMPPVLVISPFSAAPCMF